MFDLKRPCNNCPFTRANAHNFALPPERLDDIVEATAFQCHKTVDYSCYEDPKERQGDHPQQCAGLMATLHREGRHNQIMQVAIRLRALDPEKLDPNHEAFDTLADLYEAHTKGWGR